MQRPAMTTSEARKTNFKLVIALDDLNGASGNLYLDDGQSLDEEWVNHSKVDYEVIGNELFSRPVKAGFVPEEGLRVDQFVIMGLSGAVKDVSVAWSGPGLCEWNHDQVYAVITCENGFDLLAEWSLAWTV